MAVSIGNNISSLQAQRRLTESTAALSRTSERLSSGLRINKASDDAAGLQIAESLRNDSRVYGQGIRNVNDGISLLNITQDAAQQLSTIVMRQIELAEQASNGVYSYKQRKAMDAEAFALTKEYNRVIKTTSFNGTSTLTGTVNSVRLQFGYGTNGGIDVGVGTQIGYAAGDGIIGTGTTSTAVYAGGPESYGTDTGDFNRDGKLDIVSLTNSGTVSILLGNDDGTFLAGTSFVAEPAAVADTVKTADLDGDGNLDLITGYGSTGTFILMGNGDGSFRLSVSYNSGMTVNDLTTGDVNGDGIVDIATTGAGGLVGIIIGNGNGTFRNAVTYSTPHGTGHGVALADLNRDGVLDIVESSQGDSRIGVLLGNGNGSFLATVSFDIGGSGARDIAIGDINGDGTLDIASANFASSSIGILLGNGNGSFSAATTLYGGSAGIEFDLRLGDLNGDGWLDVVSADGTGNSVSTFLGNGNGTFTARRSYTTSAMSLSLTLADLNRDGILDVISSNNGASSVGIYLGEVDPTGRRNNLVDKVDLTNLYGARQALTSLKGQLSRISLELGNIGATQSRLGAASATLSSSRQNFDAAYSQLADADVAEESAALTKNKILQQSSAAVLAQAKQQPALALRLLNIT